MKRAISVCVFSLFALPALAATRNWTGTTSGTWSVASNWGGTAPVAGDDLVFGVANNANALNNDFAANTAFNSLTFSAATTFSPGGNTINLGAGGITQSGSAALNDFIPFTLTAAQTWTSASPGSIGLNGPATLNLGANTLTITGSGSDFLASTINGTGGITVGGTVVLQLSGAPLNYTGPTTVNSAANLNLTAISTIATPVIVNAGGTLIITPGFHPVSNSSLALNSGSTYAITINGSTINQYSGMTTNGNITVAGNLAITSSTVLPTGTVLNILTAQSGGVLTGTFAGLPDGSTVSSAAQSYTLHYSSTTATLTALAPGIAPPQMSKSFGAGTIASGGSTSLNFAVSNPNASQSLSGVGFNDPLPAGLVVSTPNGLTGSCGGGTITAVAGSSSVTLAGATLAASANCAFSINVTATTTGTKNNQTTNVTSNEGGSGNQGSASLIVTSASGVPALSPMMLLLLAAALSLIAAAAMRR